MAHSAAQDTWPVLFAFAGLPSLPRILAEAKSYAERFRYSPISALSPADAAEALSAPAEEEGVRWESDAVTRTVESSMCYPYYLQHFGQEIWSVAEGRTITFNDARLGIAQGMQQLDNGFFRARWDRATPAERAYLRAMAEDGDEGAPSGTIAARLDRTNSSLGPTRSGLIHKGLIYAPEHGYVAFTVPGMADFISRQPAP